MTALWSPSRRAEIKRVTAEERRRSEDAAVARAGREAQLDIERRREEMALAREQRLIDAQEKREKKAARTQARVSFAARLRELAPTVGRRVMIAGPILAPMSVAWIGQLGFATDTLNWWFVGGLVFAAAWELSTAFCGWMYHEARNDGDSGTIFRAATWFFAGTAGLMNYWHALPQGGSLKDPTPKAAAFGVMSLSGIALWELYTLLIHRKKLRADGKLPETRPRFGLARWTQFPRTTWVARSLSIRDGHTTVAAAWTAARAELDRRRRARAARRATKRAEKLAEKAGRAPITVTIVRGSGTRISTAPMKVWTQPAFIWIPTSRMPPAASHPVAPQEVTSQVTAQVSDSVTAEALTQATPDPVTQATSQVTSEATPQVTAEVTPKDMTQGTPDPVTQGTDEDTRKPGRGRLPRSRKKPRRTDEELIAELEGIVAVHHRDHPGKEIEVKPLANQLGIGRDRARRLLAQMNVRPITRKASG